MKKPLDATIKYFKTSHPGIDIEVVYGGAELSDRLLQGDKPDLLIDTAVQLSTMAVDKTVPDEQVDFGSDPIVFIVPPGNPKKHRGPRPCSGSIPSPPARSVTRSQDVGRLAEQSWPRRASPPSRT